MLYHNLLKTNLIKPSNVCANPLSIVPIAATKELSIPAMTLRMFWAMARIPVKTEPMAEKMDWIRVLIESRTEGMVADTVVVVVGWLVGWLGKGVSVVVRLVLCFDVVGVCDGWFECEVGR